MSKHNENRPGYKKTKIGLFYWICRYPGKRWSLSPRFIYYNLFTHETERYFYGCVVGSNYPALNNSDVKNLKIPLPPLPEQKKIAEILSAWDRAIEQTRKLIDAKKRLKKGLMQQLLTGRMRFREFGKPAKKRGELPEGWRLVRLHQAFSRITRPIEKEVENILSITATVGFVDQRKKFNKVIAGKNLEKYILLKKGEFAYNKGNSKSYPQGCIYRLEELEEGAVPNVYYSFAPKIDDIYGTFYRYYFENGNLNQQLRKFINAGVRNDGLLNLTADNFFNVNVIVPPVSEQRIVAYILENITSEISLLIAREELLINQKKGLMQKLLTGEIRVNVSN